MRYLFLYLSSFDVFLYSSICYIFIHIYLNFILVIYSLNYLSQIEGAGEYIVEEILFMCLPFSVSNYQLTDCLFTFLFLCSITFFLYQIINSPIACYLFLLLFLCFIVQALLQVSMRRRGERESETKQKLPWKLFL